MKKVIGLIISCLLSIGLAGCINHHKPHHGGHHKPQQEQPEIQPR